MRAAARRRAFASRTRELHAPFLELHGCDLLCIFLFFCKTRNTPHAAGPRGRATKNPARHPARALSGVVLVNTLFWKILVTRVKRKVSEFDYDGLRGLIVKCFRASSLGTNRINNIRPALQPRSLSRLAGRRMRSQRFPGGLPDPQSQRRARSADAMRAAKRGGLIIQAQLVISPDGGLATAIRNNLASAVSEGEAR